MAKEICDDMFSVLDKKNKGYVTPAEWIRHFHPQRPGTRALPQVGVDDIFGRKQMEVLKTETPRIPDELNHVLHDVFKLWTMGSQDGILTKDQLLKTLCGPVKGPKQNGGAGLTWKEAEEAVDSLFSNGRNEITFTDFANYFQDVFAVPYAKVRHRPVSFTCRPQLSLSRYSSHGPQLLAGQTTHYRPHVVPDRRARQPPHCAAAFSASRLSFDSVELGRTAPGRIEPPGPHSTSPAVSRPVTPARRAAVEADSETRPPRPVGAGPDIPPRRAESGKF